jgi:hypothetical protein
MERNLAKLLGNDPSEVFATIDLNTATTVSDEQWSEALSRNEHVKWLTFDLGWGADEGLNWDLLLREVETRAILEDVALYHGRPELTTRFLIAIQRNPVIHTVELGVVQFSGTALASFLDEATAVTTFEMGACVMEASEQDQGMINLKASIQRNTRIRKLSLGLRDDLLFPILRSLAFNSSVKELEIYLDDHTSTREACDTVKYLLESTSSIESFSLDCVSLGIAELLEPFKPVLLCAVKTNASLYHVVGEKTTTRTGFFGTTDLFNEEEKRELHYYAARNQAFSQWIPSPLSVPREAWPTVVAAARATGPGTVYRILKALGDSVGPVEGQRKRKLNP